METPQQKNYYQKFQHTPSTRLKSNQQPIYKHLATRPSELYHRNSIQNEYVQKMNHSIAFEQKSNPFQLERTGTFIKKETRGSNINVEIATQSSVDEHSPQPRDFRNQNNRSFVPLQSYQPSKVYSNPIYFAQNRAKASSRISNLEYPSNQRLSLHSNPDLQIVINNNTYQDQRLQLNVDTYDPVSKRGSLEKRNRVIPAHSKYFYESSINDQQIQSHNNQSGLERNQMPTGFSYISPRPHQSYYDSRLPEVSHFYTNLGSKIRQTTQNSTYRYQYKTLAEQGFEKIVQSPSRVSSIKPKQSNQIFIDEAEDRIEQSKESEIQQHKLEQIGRKNAQHQFQNHVQQQQDYSFKKQPSSKKSSSARFQTQNETGKAPIYKTQSYQCENQNSKYFDCKCSCHQKQCAIHTKETNNFQKTFRKKEIKYVIGKNKVLDKLKMQQNYNPLKSRLSQTCRSFDRILSKNKKLSPRCQIITDRLYNDARSKSKSRSPCPKFQKYKYSAARLKFRQKIKEYGFVQRYLTQNELNDMYIKLTKSDIPEHQWALKVIDHVYQKMNYVCKCCSCN